MENRHSAEVDAALCIRAVEHLTRLRDAMIECSEQLRDAVFLLESDLRSDANNAAAQILGEIKR